MQKEYGYFLPESVILFSNAESGNFTGYKNNISYTNENGKIVKLNEYSGKQKTIKNDIVSRFVINKSRTQIKNEYSSFHGITLYDEKRDFEFEISSTNFMNLCIFGKVERGVVEVDCVFAFGNNGYPILLPVESSQYKKAIKFTEKRQSIFSGELVVGKIYTMKKQKNKVAYLGKFKTDLEVSWGNSKNQNLLTFSENKEIFYINNRPASKDIFVNLDSDSDYDKFKSISKSSIFEEIGDLTDKDLLKHIENYKKKNSFFSLSGIKVEDFEENSKGVKFYSLFENKSTSQELLLCVDAMYCRSFSINVKNILKDSYKRGILIFRNKNNLDIVTHYNIKNLMPKDFIEFCEKIFGYDEKERKYEIVKALHTVKRTYDDYHTFDEFDVEKFLTSLIGKEVIKKQIILKGEKGNEVMKCIAFNNENLRDNTLHAISGGIASKFYQNLRE